MNMPAPVHIITENENNLTVIKQEIKEALIHNGITHSTLEFETLNEDCNDDELQNKID
ncbi:MAG: hypothetical protein M3R36_03615 [Bacteroidota bacterium]|nr:hypothetical protein [Bacteroidota bacterium]